MPGSFASEAPQSPPSLEAMDSQLPECKMNEDIVVSGISGRFPKARNMREFAYNLDHNVDVYSPSEIRFAGVTDLPSKMGLMEDVDKFDSEFFLSNPRFSDLTDPFARMAMECVYEAIVDSGQCFESMWGSRTGVFSAAMGVDSSPVVIGLDPYVFQTNTPSYVPNRIAYLFDFKGTSFVVNSFTASGLAAIDQAVMEMRMGHIDAAVVTGHCMTSEPYATVGGMKGGIASKDGRCRSFDANADGVGRSENVVALLLQKCSDARRVYTTIMHVKGGDSGFHSQGIMKPSDESQVELMRGIYNDLGLDPSEVDYVEALGMGIPEYDAAEGRAISEVFCKNRKEPLFFGSVTSNIGCTDAGSGLAAIAKVILAMENGTLAANANFSSPNPEIPALADGRLKLVTTPTAWRGDLAAVNSYNVGGANYHACLRAHDGRPSAPHPSANQLRLFTYCGRTKVGVKAVLEEARGHANSVDFQALSQASANTTTSKMPFRGYTLLNSQGLVEEVGEKCPGEKPPVWFVLPGVGSQWAGMAQRMMGLDVFRASMERSGRVLQRFGVDLCHFITRSHDQDPLEDIATCFIGITSVQIALIDLLTCVGIRPDGIIGHSLGEIAAAYADGCLTAEEAIMCSYWRGAASHHVQLPPGAMAAVGMTWEEAQRDVPEGVIAACHNSEESVTVSGKPQAIRQYVQDLKSRNIFAREINSMGVAFHSTDIRLLVPIIKRELTGLVQRRRRSTRWVSSSIPEALWDSEPAQYAGFEYFLHNLVSPVLFYEASLKIPKNAVIFEIAPDGLLGGILSSTVGDSATVVSLMERFHKNNVEHCFSSLGRAYSCGVNMTPLSLFPPVEFPVGRGTPMLSPAVSDTWNHSESFHVRDTALTTWDKHYKSYKIDLSREEFSYIGDHCINGIVLWPAAGSFVLAWHALARILDKDPEKLAVCLSDVKLPGAVVMPAEGEVSFDVRIQQSTGEFEVLEQETLVASGKIHPFGDFMCPDVVLPEFPETSLDDDDLSVMNQAEIYKAMLVRGYDYGPNFRKLLRSSATGGMLEIEWDGRWIPFLDGLLVGRSLSSAPLGFQLPVGITKLSIDPLTHPPAPDAEEEEETQIIDYFVHDEMDIASAGGVKFQGVKYEKIGYRHSHPHFISDKVSFLPFFLDISDQVPPSVQTYASCCLDYAIAGLKKALSGGDIRNKALVQDILNKTKVAGKVDSQLSLYPRTSDNSLAQLLLKSFSADFISKQTVDDAFTGFTSKLAEDQLLGFLSGMDYLGPISDCLQEGAVLNKVSVLEVDAKTSQLYKKLSDFFVNSPNTDMTVTVTDVDEFGDELTAYDAKSVKWDLSQDVPADMMGKFDYILLKNVLHKNKNITEALKKVSDMLISSTGVVAVEEFTKNFALAATVDVLHQELPQFQDRRHVGPYLNDSMWFDAFKKAGFEVILYRSDSMLSSVFALRKTFVPSRLTHLVDVSDPEASWLEDVQDKYREVMASPNANARLWLYSDTFLTGARGFANCLKMESLEKGDRIKCVIVSSLGKANKRPRIALGSEDFQALQKKDFVMNEYRDGVWGFTATIPQVPYTNQLSTSSSRAFLASEKAGDFSSLTYLHEVFSPRPDLDARDPQHLAPVYFSALNLTDVMIASGQLPTKAIRDRDVQEEAAIGLEFVARHPLTGKRIMGAGSQKMIGPTVDLRHASYCDVPDHLSMREAASLFVAYGVSLYALVLKARIQTGARIVIHSATGAVGQASVAIALHHGMEVFATVGSDEKKAYLQALFPQIPDDHISTSHGLDFEMDFLQATHGQGVDFIVNTLTGDKLNSSLALLKNGGKFIELNRHSVVTETKMELAIFNKNISFIGIDFITLLSDHTRKQEMDSVIALLQAGLDQGYVRPLQTTVFAEQQIPDAFRLMSRGEHRGKVLIQFRDEDVGQAVTPCPVSVVANKRILFSPDKSYVIVGGLGGFGLEATEWLVERGAKKLVITARSGITTAYQSYKINTWKQNGVEVRVSTSSCVTSSGARDVIKAAMEMGPVGAVFNLAMVLRDGEFTGLSKEQFQEVIKPKVYGTQNLDQVTRELCKDSLDWFVCFSSISGGRGNAEQTSYGWANSAMERVCHMRAAAGFHALAVEWGAIGDTGILMEAGEGNETVVNSIQVQRINSCKEALEFLLLNGQTVSTSFVAAEKVVRDLNQSSRLLTGVMKFFGLKDISAIEPGTTLSELGMDSIQSVQIKRLLDRNFKLIMSTKDIGSLTFAKINEIDSC